MNLSVASFVTCPYCESAFFCLAEGRQVLFSACRNTLLVEVARFSWRLPDCMFPTVKVHPGELRTLYLVQTVTFLGIGHRLAA